MAWSVLSEIHTLLGRLTESAEPSTIDLRSLPLTSADRAELEQHLGQGEVACALTVLGSTEIWETAYSGVWWVRHLDAEGEVASEEIVVATVPEILKSHPEDIAAAATRLARELENSPAIKPNAYEEADNVKAPNPG
jgi:hydrogenase-1 operon protein HyaF